jgi:hypothetical protein
MKKIFTTIALLTSVISFSQNIEYETIKTDSMSSSKSKGASSYEFYYTIDAVMYGKTTQHPDEFSFYSVESITKTPLGIDVYTFKNRYRMYIDKSKNEITLELPSGSKYKYY